MDNTKKPNIVIIMTDQQSHNMMSCTGNQYLSTPAMDSLAETGVRFDRAYCTNPLCMPSRFSIMTGRMPEYINLRDNTANFSWDMLDDIRKQGIGWLFKDAGYDTVYGGKVHLPAIGPAQLGFDYLTNDQRDALADVCAEYILQGRDKPFLMVASFINPHGICFASILQYGGKKMIDHFMSMDEFRITIETFNKIKARAEDIPIEELYNVHCPPLPDNFGIQEDEPGAVQAVFAEGDFLKRPRMEYTEEDWRLYRWYYCRLVEAVDAQIGRLLDALRVSGKEENTVVIFTSDHGDMGAAHQMMHKVMLYDESSRIPMIISRPGSTRKGYVDTKHLVSNGLDIIPTICDYAGITIPYDLPGVSLKDLAEGRDVSNWRNIVPVESTYGRALITERYKYSYFDVGENREQLIDLVNDPGEMRNAADDEENKEILEVFRRIWSDIWAKTETNRFI